MTGYNFFSPLLERPKLRWLGNTEADTKTQTVAAKKMETKSSRQERMEDTFKGAKLKLKGP
jgi:hypothetical protein